MAGGSNAPTGLEAPSQGSATSRAPRGRRRTPRRLLANRALAFVIAGALIAYTGFEGAAYDLVVRQEVFLGVWVALALGVATGILPRSRFPWVARFAFFGGLALVAWTLLSLTWTDSAERTVDELARLLGVLGVVLLALLALNRHTARAAAAGLTVGAIAVIAVAVASRLSPDTFPNALDAQVAFPSLLDRLSFPLDYWNAVGAWGAMVVVLLLGWSAHAKTLLVRAASLSIVPLVAVAVYLTYSRGALLAVAAGLAVSVLLSRNRWTTSMHLVGGAAGSALAILVARDQEQIANATGGKGAGAVVLALLGAAAICAAVVVFGRVVQADRAKLEIPRWALVTGVALALPVLAVALAGPVSNAWDEFNNDETSSAGRDDPASRLTNAGGSRDEIWESAIDAFESRPFTGIGPGTFEFWWQMNGDEEFLRDAHSLYLEALAETGIPGLLALLAFLGGLAAIALSGLRAKTSLRESERGLVAIGVAAFSSYLVSAGVDWMWEETAVTLLGLGSLAIAAAGTTSRRRSQERSGTLFGRGWVRPALVAAAVAIAALQVPGLVSTSRLQASERASAAGDLESAQLLAEQAVDAESWSASAHARLSNVLRQRGRISEAQNAIDEAIRLEPLNWRWPLVSVLAQAEAGERKSARQAFQEGRRLAPEIPFYSPFSGYGQLVFSERELRERFERQQAKATGS